MEKLLSDMSENLKISEEKLSKLQTLDEKYKKKLAD